MKSISIYFSIRIYIFDFLTDAWQDCYTCRHYGIRLLKKRGLKFGTSALYFSELFKGNVCSPHCTTTLIAAILVLTGLLIAM